MKLSDIGERGLIERLSRKIAIGDDAACIRFGNSYLVISTDMLYGKTDILPEMNFEQIGKLAVTVNLSDIAAMGAKPIAFLLSYGSPDMEVDDFEGIIKGVEKQCKKFDVTYAGGDTNETDELILSGTALGLAKRPVMRSGAKVGDIICVTGELGTAALGVEISTKKLRINEGKILKKALEPEPRVCEGLVLGKYASSMMDISDSFAVSLHEIAKQSRVGAEINLENLPITENARKIAEKLHLDMRDFALYGGGDYELLFTIPKRYLSKIKRNVEFNDIGQIVKTGVVGLKNGKTLKIEQRGYEHFKKDKQ